MGVETDLYLIDRRSYHEVAVPALQALFSGETEPARALFVKACAALARESREHPWGPLHRAEDQIEFGLSLIDGTAEDLRHPDPSITDPELARRHHLLDVVCGTVIEGTCVPWSLPFPPHHCVTCDGSIWELYQSSEKFESVFTAEIYVRSRPAPFSIGKGDELVNDDLVLELFGEISKVSPPGHPLSERSYFRNLYLLLESACRNGYQIMASYC